VYFDLKPCHARHIARRQNKRDNSGMGGNRGIFLILIAALAWTQVGCNATDAFSSPDTTSPETLPTPTTTPTSTPGPTVTPSPTPITTTYAAETGINSSASSSFASLMVPVPNKTPVQMVHATQNGDAAPGNVSKLSIHTLAPTGFTGKFFAHYMPWWGSSGHWKIGYSSQDPTQIAKIVSEIKSRGYDGMILAQANTDDYDRAAQTLTAPVADSHGLEIIAGENSLDGVASADAMTQLYADMTYFNAHYFNLAHYYRINGRPVVMVFDNNSAIDWNKASSAAAGQPIFIYRNQAALTETGFSGGFSWFGETTAGVPQTGAQSLTYLTNFYKAALGLPTKIAAGDYWKGFNDTLASWTKNRVVLQQCGQTWLQTLGALSAYAPNHLGALPIVEAATWDDYEEGTEVETGIDNCGSISANYTSANLTLNFAPAFSSSDGTENTVDHYEVYASQDGVNLTLVSHLPVGSRSFSVSNLGLPPISGSYQFYVKMVGKSHILNHLSNGVSIKLSN